MLSKVGMAELILLIWKEIIEKRMKPMKTNTVYSNNQGNMEYLSCSNMDGLMAMARIWFSRPLQNSALSI